MTMQNIHVMPNNIATFFSAKLNLKVSENCIADYSKRYTEDKANVCGDNLYCATCVESANEYLNNTKCLAVGE